VIKYLQKKFSGENIPLLMLLTIILTISSSNLIIQFFLRFLLIDWIRVFAITLLVNLILFFPVFHSVKKVAVHSRTHPKSWTLLIIAISLLGAALFYALFPGKITGNLLLLENANLLFYRFSRLVNIISFMLSIAFLILLMILGLVNKLKTHPRWTSIAILFFITVLMTGLFIYDDYGISSDEPNERTNGLVSAQYFADFIEEKFPESDPYLPKLSTYRYRYYGVAYQFPMAVIEHNIMLRGESIWLFRHLMNFLFFYAGVIAMFHLGADFFNDGRLGLLGASLLILNPRIFSHAFFNPKDTIFLAVFTVALYFSVRFWKEPIIKNALPAAITIAYASNVRIIALSLVLISAGLFFVDLIGKTKKVSCKPITLMVVVCGIFLFLFWPASWQDPLAYLGNVIRLFSDYTYWDFEVMYMGEFIRGAEVPWHYLPVWIGITIPIMYLVCFLFGTGITLKKSFQQGWRTLTDHRHRTQIIFLLLFLVPPLLAIVLNSTLYNGWRHFQFIQAPFVMVILIGINFGLNETKTIKPLRFRTLLFPILLALLFFNMLFAGYWMINHHPHQYVFFNRIGYLAGRENFERDYWRISMKQGLEFLLDYDSSDELVICTEEQFQDPQFINILPENDRSRILFISFENGSTQCKYGIETYRWEETIKKGRLIHDIEVDGLPILSIYLYEFE